MGLDMTSRRLLPSNISIWSATLSDSCWQFESLSIRFTFP